MDNTNTVCCACEHLQNSNPHQPSSTLQRSCMAVVLCQCITQADQAALTSLETCCNWPDLSRP